MGRPKIGEAELLRLPICTSLFLAFSANTTLSTAFDCDLSLETLPDPQIEARALACPNNESMLYHLGKVRIRSGEYAEARLIFLRALAMPGDLEKQLRLALGDIELHRGDYAAARDIYLSVATDFPNWYIAHDFLGFAYFANGQLDLARTSLLHSIELKESAATYRTLALVTYSLGLWEESIDAVNRGYSLDEALLSDRDFMIAGIRSYTEIGRFDIARGLLGALLKSRPDLKTDDEFLRAGFHLKERMVEAGAVVD